MDPISIRAEDQDNFAKFETIFAISLSKTKYLDFTTPYIIVQSVWWDDYTNIEITGLN